jgi:hypothetical protein
MKPVKLRGQFSAAANVFRPFENRPVVLNNDKILYAA